MSAPRLGPGLLPPTNRWFSGLVFGANPQPVFPLPLAFTLTKGGFGVGLPQVVTSEKGIAGSHQADVSFAIQGVSKQLVTAYDDATVTISGSDGARETGRTVVAEGSPFISHLASVDERLSSSVSWTSQGGAYVATTPTGTYGLRVHHGSVSGSSIDLSGGGWLVVFPVSEGSSLSQLAAYANPVVGASATYSVDDENVRTTLTYRTANNAATATVRLPAQRVGGEASGGCTLGTFASIFGRLPLCSGAQLSWTVPARTATLGLDVGGLDAADKAALAQQVAADVAGTPAPPSNTYYGGKWLYRMAQLWQLATAAGATDAAATAKQRLETTLLQWTQPTACAQRDEFCFVYDPVWKGVVGQVVDFGTDQFNDHYFHYGYFLYAAAVLAKADPSVVGRLRPVISLLAADIAAPSTTARFPRLRVFDIYASHSWASGTAPFADGNNQESSSEAINAWAGLQLWGEAIGDAQLASEGRWLMSLETAAASANYVAFDRQDPVYAGLKSSVLSLTWGNKRDYATWFSSAPQAMLGIQLIPMSPSAVAGLKGNGSARIVTNVDSATASGGFAAPLGDYILMYSALAGPKQAQSALAAAKQLPDSAIDDGNSRSYLMAFLMTAAHG